MHQANTGHRGQDGIAEGDPFALAEDSEFGIPFRTAQAILAHPRFPEARTMYLRGVLNLYGDDPFLNKLLLESARQIVFGATICLMAAHRADDRSTWPTLANLKRVLRPFGQSSDRRIEQLVARLISVGYLTQSPIEHDGRVRLILPSDLMLRHDEDWLIAHYVPLALLYPGDQYHLPLARDRSFQMAQRKVSFDFIPRSAMVLMSNPDIMLFGSRDAGFLVLAQILLDAGNQSRTSFEDLARRFAVSRTHVRQLLRDAQDRQLLRLAGRGGQEIILLPALWNAVDRFVADGMSGHDLTGSVARRAIGATSESVTPPLSPERLPTDGAVDDPLPDLMRMAGLT